MPIHWEVNPFKIEEQIDLLKRANKKITHIIPTTIEHKPGNLFGIVVGYAIIFEDISGGMEEKRLKELREGSWVTK